MWNNDYSSMTQFHFLPAFSRSPIAPFSDPVASGFATGMIALIKLNSGKKRHHRFTVEWVETLASRQVDPLTTISDNGTLKE